MPEFKGQACLRRGRHSAPNGHYLITTVVHQRTPLFREWQLGHAVARTLKDSLPAATTLCWVLMPDHLHILLALEDEDLSVVVGRLKSRTAAAVNSCRKTTGRIWMPGFHDHALREEEDQIAVARYVIANPLRAGLADTPATYPFWDAIWL